MTDVSTAAPTIFERLLAARRRIEGEDGEDGLQAWYRAEIAERTGWEPSKSTVHRYVRGDTPLDERARDVLDALEAEADEAGPYDPTAEADLPDLGAKRERNVLLVADWIRGASYGELRDRYGISKTMAAKIVERADVRRLDEVADP